MNCWRLSSLAFQKHAPVQDGMRDFTGVPGVLPEL